MSSYLNFVDNSVGSRSEVYSGSLPGTGEMLAVDPYKRIKQGIWLYFLLLILEGALRKWVLPGLAAPLLIVRDPLALGLVLITLQKGLLPRNIYLIGTCIIGLVGIFTAVLFGHGSFSVALFGARILLLHFPLMFVIGQLFNKADVVKMGRATLWLAIPMTILIALQFYSPQSAWVNRGIGGDMGGAGFSGSMGYLRPPGTFSFINGLTAFYGLVSAFLIYFWFAGEKVNRWLLVCATLALLAAVPLSISRSLFFQVIVCLIFSLFGVVRKPEHISKFITAAFGFLVAVSLLSQTHFFSTATEAFTHRFELANENEGGLEGVLLDRYLGGMLRALSTEMELPLFGYGLGMGTNVGSTLLAGKREFLISEGEWGRLIGEMGLLMGMLMIIFRLGFCLQLLFAAYKKLLTGNFLPWMLLSYGLLVVPQGQWAQPTALGFSTLIGGLMIASLKDEMADGPTFSILPEKRIA